MRCPDVTDASESKAEPEDKEIKSKEIESTGPAANDVSESENRAQRGGEATSEPKVADEQTAELPTSPDTPAS